MQAVCLSSRVRLVKQAGGDPCHAFTPPTLTLRACHVLEAASLHVRIHHEAPPERLTNGSTCARHKLVTVSSSAEKG